MSAISLCRQTYSLESAAAAKPPAFTSHQPPPRGKPPTTQHATKCKAYAVEAKSRHFFARSTSAATATAQATAAPRCERAVIQLPKERKSRALKEKTWSRERWSV